MELDSFLPIPRTPLPPAIRPIAVAAFFVLFASLWTLVLQQALPYPFLFLFIGAVMASAWFGGLLSGLMAVAASSLIVAFFFIPPYFSFSIATVAIPYFISFVILAFAVGWVTAYRKRTEFVVRQARDLLEVRVFERTVELERSHADLARSEARLRELAQAIPQQIWSTGLDGNVDFCNAHLLDCVGRSLAELCGPGFLALIHPDERDHFQESWVHCLASRLALDGEWRVQVASGDYRRFLIRARPQLDSHGAVSRWYGTLVDMEDHHLVQASLHQAQKDLEYATRMMSISEVSASIAHEVSQPLTAIVAHAHACLSWLSGKQVDHNRALLSAQRILADSSRARETLDRLRALFRRERLTCRSHHISALFRETALLLREESISRGVRLRIEAPSTLPSVQCDAVQIQQVLVNLVRNAMEAMADTPLRLREIVLRAELDPAGQLLVSVLDRGIGIPADQEEKVFNSFFTTKPDGLGMGLSICRSIVQAHEGSLWSFPRPSGGTAFQFTLPAAA